MDAAVIRTTRHDDPYGYYGFLLIHNTLDSFQAVTFTYPGTDIVMQVKRPKNIASFVHDHLQIRLIEPADDIIQVDINGFPGSVLLNGVSSAVFQTKLADAQVSHDNYHYYAKLIPFRMTTAFKWKLTFLSTTRVSSDAVTVQLKTLDGTVAADKESLVSKSDVFKAMFDHDSKEALSGVVEISDFSLEVVTQMARYALHGYCSGWTKHYDQLLAIADKYNIEGMKKLAEEKKGLMDRIS